MSIRDNDSIVAVSVFCDECEFTITSDYTVPKGMESLNVARYNLATYEGWMIAKVDDICPVCLEDIRRNEPEFYTALEKSEIKWSKPFTR